MKIAYLANIKFPSERAHALQIAQMCRSFSDIGVDLTLFTNTRSKASIDEIQNYYKIPVTFTVKRLSHGFFLPRIKVAYYASEILFAISFLRKKYQRDFDSIYSRQEWIVWFLSLFLDSSKLIWESHEAKLNFPARQLLKKGIKVVVISEGIFNEYVSFGAVSEQLFVVHDAIDESFFGAIESKEIARKRLELPEDKKIAMYIGGFDGWKGVDTFFAASELLSGVAFVAIGGRDEQVNVFKQKYPKVTFLGQLPYSDLKNNQQAADILVIPNSGKTELSARYTSPLKLFAHMASGVPIVASDLPSLVTVTGRESVTLVQSDNPEAFASGIDSIFANYDHKRQLAQELKYTSRRYTWGNRARSITEALIRKEVTLDYLI